VLTWVRLYDRKTQVDEWVEASTVDLRYRYSNIKFTQRAVVLAIEMQLTTDGLSAPLNFRQLTEDLGERRRVNEVRATVLQLRRGTGMVLNPNDRDAWSAGSFFPNPIVAEDTSDEVAQRVPAKLGDEVAETMPRFDAEGGKKLSAAWLIERA